MGNEVILVVDDDEAVRKVLVALLAQAGYATEGAPSAEAALEVIDDRAVDLVITDVRMPNMDGLMLLAGLADRAPDLPVIMISAHGTVAMAVEAMKLGAKEFVTKPFDRDEVLAIIERTLRASPARSAPPALPVASRLVGESPAMTDLRAMLGRAAQSVATVLLRGESGTGKEVAAREVHELSARRAGPFVAVHCAALPETLLESELFGYEKGAFTGAANRKPGRVELAEGGTLFLDEIGDISPPVQVKLLRLLQEREYSPVGGTSVRKADVRFIAATHRDLEAMIGQGEFRQDVFYRLNVFPVWMPPLRERREDIPALAQRFCAEAAARNGVRRIELSGDAQAALASRMWAGNVRELQSCVERLVVFADAEEITADDVERDEERSRPSQVRAPPTSLGTHVDEAERTAIEEALARCRGNRTLAARLLGVSRRTLYNKLAAFGAGE
jgi:DNA-binding NtrC family response regulator